jgi:small subunit ribosomal protein S8
MSMNDPLSDMLTRIRNGQQAAKPVIEVPFSRLHENVATVLKDEGFIRESALKQKTARKTC